MTGLERNADVVELASYAPLFARIGYTQWSPDMIWFDGKTSYETPSYYVQQMYSLYTGSMALYTELQEELSEKVYVTASFDGKNKNLYIKLVNVTDNDIEILLNTKEAFPLTGEKINDNAREIVLTGSGKEAVNSIDEPDNIKPVERKIILGEKYTLKGNSFTILIL